MLTRLITFSLHYRPVVLLLAIILLGAGAVAVREAPWDIFPEFAPPQLVVQTEAQGLSTEEVERLVTIPVESTVNGVSRLKTLRSSSAPGLSVVTAIFEDGTDILDARQLVNERLGELGPQLPEGVQTPRLTPLAASTSKLLMIGLTSDTVSLEELRTLADWTWQRRLRAVRGVAHVEVFGGDVRQYQILVRPEQLNRAQVSLDQVVTAARQATGFGGAGFIETPAQRLPVQQRTRIESPDDLAAVPVVIEDGVVVTLGQVAEVTTGSRDKVGDAVINGQSGVLLVIHKQPSFNTLAVTEDVQQAVEALRPSLPDGVDLHVDLFRQATFIERAISNLNVAILVGAVLVALILIAFLFQWRTVVISLTAIPLSLLGAVLILRACGVSLNAMTLGGLAIALGELVDDAIVDVENVLRRLRQWRLAIEDCRLHGDAASPQSKIDNQKSAIQVVLAASLEVRSAVVYASFIVILVFVPVFFMGGLGGTFFRPLGLAYIAAIVVSLIVALTVTPAMCLWLLGRETRVQSSEEGKEAPALDSRLSTLDSSQPPLVRVLMFLYLKTLGPVLNWPKLTIAVSVLLLGGALAVAPFLGGAFLPDFRESNFVVFMGGKPDSSLVESRRMGKLVSERLRDIPGVRSVAQQIGRADLSEDTWGPNISELWVTLDADADSDGVLHDINESLEDVPGAVFQTKQFLRERIDEVLTGARSDIVIRVVGPDLTQLRQQAALIADAIEEIDGVDDMQVEQQVDVPQIEVLLRPRHAARFGYPVGALNDNIQTLLRGSRVGQVYDQDRVFDVIVRAHPDLRRDPQSLGDIRIDAPTGEFIPLSAVADIHPTQAPNLINREQTSRRILVTCNAKDRDVASVIADIQSRIAADVPLQPGYRLEFAGEHAARSEAQSRLLLLSAAALLGIFMLLYLDLRSMRLSLLVMLSVPLACVGGVAAILLSGGDVSLGSLVGFVTVFGIAVRNGILLITSFRHVKETEPTLAPRDVILRGAGERLAPILMTAGSTALALLPLILRGDIPGHEIEHPMAIVITGGLVSSTFLTLYLLPVLCRSQTTANEPDRDEI